MKIVEKIEVKDIENPLLIAEQLLHIQEESISCINWKDEFPSAPQVSFKIAHNGTHLFLQYMVEEDEILAKTEEDNGPVWTDSCVEFFISLGQSAYYYNLESSCIGKILFAHRTGREDAVHATKDIMHLIKRYPSLGNKPFDKKKGNFEWNLLLVIPAEAFWQSNIKSFCGLEARANAYKCGDNLSVPHFLTWKPIENISPNFHLPRFFHDLKFEK